MDYVNQSDWKEANDAILTSVKDIRSLVESQKDDGSSKKELDSKIEAIQESVKSAESKSEAFTLQYEEEKKAAKAQEDRINDLEAKLARPSVADEEKHNHKHQLEAMNNIMRNGNVQDVKTESDYKELLKELVEKKYLRTDVNPDGGYLVVPEYVNEIIKDIVEISPVRSVARIMQTSRNSVQIPKRVALVQGGWNGEGIQAKQGQSVYGNEEIPLNKLSVYTIVTNELLNDSEFNVAQEVQSDVTEDFAKLEGKGFIDGVAANSQPEGMLSDPSIQKIETENTGALDLDTFIKTQGELKSGYNASWMMNRRTIAQVRMLKDNDGQYLWNPDSIVGQPLTLLGDTVISAIDVPDVAAGSLSVIYGDYFQGYLIVDRTTMTMVRDNLTLADYDQTKFVFHRRVGGHVRQPEALKIIEVKS